MGRNTPGHTGTSTTYRSPLQTTADSLVVPALLDEDEGEGVFAAEGGAFKREMLGNLALSGALAGAQAIGSINTIQDRENRKALKALQDRKDAGELGLEGEERQLLEKLQMDPVRAHAKEQRMRSEAFEASKGDAMSAAGLARIKREARQDIQKAAREAGLKIATADLDEKRRELGELESRIAYKGQRQQQRLESVSEGVAQAAGLVGKTMAGRAVPKLDIAGLEDAGYTTEDIVGIVRQVEDADTAWQKRRLIETYTTADRPRTG